MKITALVENTSKRDDLKTVHGLSVHIETPKHKLLFDLGPDDTYIKNATTLGINLEDVDTVVISHGHYDHGGALASFLKINGKANIYIRRQAFQPNFIANATRLGTKPPAGWPDFQPNFITNAAGDKLFIGLDADLVKNERIIFTDDPMRIDDELLVFSHVEGALDMQSRHAFFKQTPDGYAPDNFDHEQHLIVTTEDKAVLFSGCSHSGVDGILPAALRHKSGIKAVFGGFHLYNPASGVTEPAEVVRELAGKLAAYETVFYTCHCTGSQAFECLRETMGEKLRYFSTGTVVEV